MSKPMMEAGPRADAGRQLQELAFAESSTLTRDLPKDTAFRALQVRLSGSIITTYASGTPVASVFSTMDDLVSRMEVTINGGFTLKSVRPHLMHMQQLLTKKIRGERKASAGASAAVNNNPTADAGFTYGTTGQVTTVAETILISFENPYASINGARTMLQGRGLQSLELKISTKGYSSLLGSGNTAPVVYTGSTFKFEIYTIEDKSIPEGVVFDYWKQTTKEFLFTGESTDYRIDLGVGDKLLQGLMFLARNGNAGSATTATGRTPDNNVLRRLSVKVGGDREIQTTTFQALQAKNRSELGISAPFSGNVSQLDGVAYMNFISKGDLLTSLDVRRADSLDLYVSTSNSTDVSYAAGCSVVVQQDEVILASGR